MSYGPSEILRDKIRQVRGAILVALYQSQPLTRTILLLVVRASELGLDNDAVIKEIEYLEKRGWVSIQRNVGSALGRKDWSLKLTADGEDAARGIDPASPLMPAEEGD